MLIGIGGLVLGPIVQKYAFGAYWTGWPFGEDLTDNKTLVMWLAWVVGGGRARAPPGAGRPRGPLDRGRGRLVMIAVYLVPHSLRGSQLDYGKVEGGGAAKDAITTGR